LSRTGVVANYLKELGHIKDMIIEIEKDDFATSSESEDEELNQDLMRKRKN